jgi:uncharacterized protein (TIGR00730 family)
MYVRKNRRDHSKSSKTQGMKRQGKAYKNLDFLSSPDARLVRILSEYLEPQARFKHEGVKDTIVFFGSSRVVSRKEALKNRRNARKMVAKARKPNRSQLVQLRDAEMRVEMSRYYEDCVELARLLTKWAKSVNSSHRFVVCSGGGPGIMEAASRGAALAKGPSVGLNISLPFEQESNAFVSKDLGFEFHYFFMRKFWFAYLSKALVIFPGGFGTMDELMEMLTLLQTAKIKKKVAVVIYGSEYWNKVLNLEEMRRRGVISRKDLSLIRFCDSPREAFVTLRHFLTKNYLKPT